MLEVFIVDIFIMLKEDDDKVVVFKLFISVFDWLDVMLKLIEMFFVWEKWVVYNFLNLLKCECIVFFFMVLEGFLSVNVVVVLNVSEVEFSCFIDEVMW